jgi:putative hemolysin
VDGLIPFDEFATIFHRRGDEVGRYPTLHAFMVARLDDPPRRTAVVGWKGLRLEIVDMDGSRVDQVLVTEEPAAVPADSDPGARRPPRPDN